MRNGRIGVWFSVALAILVLGAWVGWKLGGRIAVYSYGSSQRRVGTLPATERAHFESVMAELDAIHWLRLYAAISTKNKELRKKYLATEIASLEDIRRKSDTQEIKPVIDLYLGVAYASAAMVEEQDNNKQLATKYTKSAQPLFQSVGWQDYSEETLRTVAKRELDRWNARPQTKQSAK